MFCVVLGAFALDVSPVAEFVTPNGFYFALFRWGGGVFVFLMYMMQLVGWLNQGEEGSHRQHQNLMLPRPLHRM